MLNFDYCNRTHYVYGPGQRSRIGELLKPLARKVLLHYGGGSIRRTGLYDCVVNSLKAAGVDFIELGGVKPNPSLALARKGIDLCRAEGVDLVLAVGGGSVIDSAKCIALGVPAPQDVWEYYTQGLPIDFTPLPVATILTLPAAGSENSPNTVITNEETSRKLAAEHQLLRPVLSIVDPELFLTLPPSQMAYGACDMLCHIFERYFSNTPDTQLSDALCEATMRTIMQQALVLRDNPKDVNAWGQLALSGTVAHNDLLGVGREQSWACHRLEHELSAVYDVPHGGGLAVVVPPYMEAVWKANPGIFAQWAVNVMGVTANRDTAAVIREGIARLRSWYRAIGLPQTMQELGIPADADYTAMAHAACHDENGNPMTLPGVLPLDQPLAESIMRAAVAPEA